MMKPRNVHNLISDLLSAPVFAFFTLLFFSLYSPIGLGSLDTISAILIGLLFLSVIPILTVFYSFIKGLTDLEISDRKKRTVVFLINLLSYVMCSLVYFSFESHVLFVLSMAYVAVTFSITLINLFWKISVHSAGIAGPTTALVYVFGLSMSPLYLLLIPVFWVRFKLKAHDFLQLVIGALLAMFVTYLVYFTLW